MREAVRVLLVEDNPGDADLTRETLEETRLDLDISVVVDGAHAVDYLLGQPPYTGVERPDLVVLDLNLPKIDDRAVLAEMRRHEHLRAIPVVILTSSDAEKDVAESYLLGANCYVTKSVDLQSFQAAVRAIESFWFNVVQLPPGGR